MGYNRKYITKNTDNLEINGVKTYMRFAKRIKDMNDFAKVNEIYASYFTKDCPARSCVEVARLPKDVLIEIEAIAYK